MPFAARFVQDHSVTAIHNFDSGVTAFYPASSEVIHSFGILLMGNDVLSPLINTLWLGLALLASWCIGRPFGVGAVTLRVVRFCSELQDLSQPSRVAPTTTSSGSALLLSAVCSSRQRSRF